MDYKLLQQDLTELNSDGNRERGRYGEDVSKKKNLVLVETFATYRMRYMIEQYESEPTEYALDTVTNEEAEEFSQLYLGEQISSHRVVSKEECVKMYLEDNNFVNDISYKRLKKHCIHAIDYDEE